LGSLLVLYQDGKKLVNQALLLQPTHLTAYYWFITSGCRFFHEVKDGLIELRSREECIQQYRYVIDTAKEKGLNLYFDYNFTCSPEYEYAIERDMFRHFPVRAFGPNAWSQKGRIKITNHRVLKKYAENPFEGVITEYSVDLYMLRTLMYPQGMVFNEFEQIFKSKWAFRLLSQGLQEAFSSWFDKGFVIMDDAGIRFKRETWEQSAIYLAEFQTKAWYCPEKDLPILKSR
jgi:coproporphyrinogen III oxidase-like Fe-S oxidoreductase